MPVSNQENEWSLRGINFAPFYDSSSFYDFSIGFWNFRKCGIYFPFVYCMHTFVWLQMKQ